MKEEVLEGPHVQEPREKKKTLMLSLGFGSSSGFGSKTNGARNITLEGAT